MTRARALAGLAAFVAVNVAVSALGGWATAASVGTWYQGLAKPAFNPPDWVFAPVWSALYLMIAIAGWRAWRRAGAQARGALTVYAVQLALNLSWSFVFFGARLIGPALAVIAALLAAIAANAFLFWRIDRWAGALLVPYAAWVAFAAALNAALWRLNPGLGG
jgi:tryptophan-rich sensory protein